MGLLRQALLVAAAAACAAAAAPTTIFVAPTGSDSSGDGSLSKPFASLQRAQTAVRAVNQAMQSDIFVYFRAGAYFLGSTATFTQPDSGSNGFTVRYCAYPGDAPAAVVLHGGVAVTGWAQTTTPGVWSAPLPAGINDARQAYIGTDPTGWMDRMNATNTGAGIPGTVTITPTGYTTDNVSVLGWLAKDEQNPADIEFLYTGVGSSWTECRARVEMITPLPGGGANITMQQPGFSLARNRPYGQGVSTPASVSNLFTLLSASTPGQYYLNSASRTLYYVPRPQDNMATAVVIVPALEALIEVQGDRAAQPSIQPVHHLSFEGLTFAYAGWLEPNSGLGYVDMQSGFRVMPNSSDNDDSWSPVPGNVRMHTVQNVSVIGCTFTHLGAVGLSIDEGSQSVVVANSTFTDLSCGGVYLGQVDDVNTTDPTRMNAHMLVYNNLFSGIPVEYHDCAALLGGYLINATFSHNSILNNANTGISLGWGWSRDEATNAGYNTISNNYVYGSNWLLEDGGSLYVLGPQPHSLMSENYISNQRKLFGALYTDEGSAYWTLDRNVVHNVPEWLHIWIATCHDEIVSNCWTDSSYQVNHGTNITLVNNTILSPGQPFPPDAQAVIAAAGTLDMAGPKP